MAEFLSPSGESSSSSSSYPYTRTSSTSSQTSPNRRNSNRNSNTLKSSPSNVSSLMLLRQQAATKFNIKVRVYMNMRM